MSEFGSIIPVLWQVEPWAPAEVQIIVNWLEIEIERNAAQRLPLLAEIKGHRNREVHDYIWQWYVERRDEELTELLYGNMPFYSEGR